MLGTYPYLEVRLHGVEGVLNAPIRGKSLGFDSSCFRFAGRFRYGYLSDKKAEVGSIPAGTTTMSLLVLG